MSMISVIWEVKKEYILNEKNQDKQRNGKEKQERYDW